ncbi:MAG: hypothetical protein R6V59_05420 [Dehalococcoidia bacterium]
MVERPVIQRYLSPDIWEGTKKDLTLKRLVRLINNSGGEYSLQLRENYFNIYYRGNSLAKVIPDRRGTYTARIHREFLQLDEPDKILRKLRQYSSISETSQNADSKRKYVTFRIQQGRLYHFFHSNHLKALSSNIREVGYGEEITFEQVLITDNPPSDKFIIVDRQVADHKNKAQMDLLALRRDSANGPFHFVVIEVKLGRNPELREKVGRQLNAYVDHIGKYMKDYVDCYKENYRQKKDLGVFDPFGPCLPNEIDIDEDEKTVEGLIVVGGYSGLAEQALQNLCQQIREKQWDVKVQRMRNEIKMDNKSYCEELSTAT